MIVSLISPYHDITSLSTRILGSVLRKAGHTPRLIFMPDYANLIEHGVDFAGSYSESSVEQLLDIVSGSDLVGFSLMTNHFLKTSQLSYAVRQQLSLPVIWGGVHPTVAPEECLDHADYVCVGEGEGALIDLIGCMGRGDSPADILNLWLRRDGSTVRNLPRKPVPDLDKIPIPDYAIEDQFVLMGENIVPLSETILKATSRGKINFTEPEDFVYETMWTRGCPHNCSYCINNRYRNLYSGEIYVRRRSIDHLMSELVSMRERFPWFNRISFIDDCFAAAPLETLAEFRDRYLEEISLPFFCLNSIQSSKPEKIHVLYQAGMRKTQIGIQSLSQRTNRLYKRESIDTDKVLRTAESIRENAPEVLPTYDIILDNPFESPDDVLATLRGVLKLPRPFLLQLFSLTFYPGTEIFDKALAEGMISGSVDSYLKENHSGQLSYFRLLFMLVTRGCPVSIVRILAWRPLVRIMESRFVRRIYSILDPLYRKSRESVTRRKRSRRFDHFIRDLSNPSR